MVSVIPLDSETQVLRTREMDGDGVDEAGSRVRKPYTITKSRESWTEPEHDKFLEALQLFDRDWRKIEVFIGSKTVIQIRSHAQKYFLKVQKNGTGEHLPPPRPKRKAAHPYPHKASKRAPQVVLPQCSHIMEQGCAIPMDASTIATDSSANDALPSWDNDLAQHFSPRHDTTGSGATNNCSSSIESQSGTWPTSEAIEQEIVLPALRAMPDFAQVYNFLGSVFDPETSGHLQRLREMDPIDAETVLLLMKNLSMNLSSPNFEEHTYSNTTSTKWKVSRVLIQTSNLQGQGRSNRYNKYNNRSRKGKSEPGLLHQGFCRDEVVVDVAGWMLKQRKQRKKTGTDAEMMSSGGDPQRRRWLGSTMEKPWISFPFPLHLVFLASEAPPPLPRRTRRRRGVLYIGRQGSGWTGSRKMRDTGF